MVSFLQTYGEIVILNWVDGIVAGVVSVTFTTKLNAPVVVGLPEITPVVPLRVNPGGSEPLPRAQVYGGLPPVTPSVNV